MRQFVVQTANDTISRTVRR